MGVDMISGVGSADLGNEPFSLLSPNGTTTAPTGEVYDATGQLVPASDVYTNSATLVPSGGAAGGWSTPVQNLNLYNQSAVLYGTTLKNALGETDGSEVSGYVEFDGDSQQATGASVYDSRGNLVATIGYLGNDSYFIENSQGTYLDATDALASAGISQQQQSQELQLQTQQGAAWDSSPELESILGALTQYALIDGERDNTVTNITDVYDANGNYAGSFGAQQSNLSFVGTVSSGSAWDETASLAETAGISSGQQAAEISTQDVEYWDPTATMAEDQTAVDLNLGALMLAQNKGGPESPLISSSGAIIGSAVSISALFDSSGNYAGSIGLDPVTGNLAIWDTSGHETNSAAGMTTDFIRSLSPGSVAGFSPAIISSFSTAQIAALSIPDIQQLSAPQVGAINPSAFNGTITISALNTQQLAGVTAAQVINSSSQDIFNLSSGVTNLTASAFAGLSTAELQHFDGASLANVSGGQLNALDAQQLAELTAQTFSRISTPTVSALSTSALNAMSLSAFSALPAGLSGTQLNAIDVAHLQAFDAGAFTVQSLYALSALSTSELTTSQISTINPDAMSVLNSSALTASQIGALTTEQISSISWNLPNWATSALQYFSAAQISAISTEALEAFSPDQLDALGLEASQTPFNQTNAAPAPPLSTFTSYCSVGNSAVGLTGSTAYAWNGSSWTQLAGQFSKVIVAADQSIWGIDTGGNVERLNGGQWVATTQHATDIASDSSGKIYIADSTIKEFIGGNFLDVASSGNGFTNVALGANDAIFALQSDGTIWQNQGLSWNETSGNASQLIGGGGQVFALGSDSQVYQWDGASWSATGEYARSIGNSSSGDVSVVDSQGLLIPDLLNAQQGPIAALSSPTKQFSTNGTISVATSASGEVDLWNGQTWTDLGGLTYTTAIVAGDGSIWATNDNETDQYVDGTWQYRGYGMGSLASDANGQVYGTQPIWQGGDVMKYYAPDNGWEDLGGGGSAAEVTVGKDGTLFTLSESGTVKFQTAGSSGWGNLSVPSLADLGIASIAAAGDGSLYMTAANNYGALYSYNFQTGDAQAMGGGNSFSISADARGQLSMVDLNGFVTPDVAEARSVALGTLDGISQVSSDGTTAVALGSGAQANTAYLWNGQIWQQLAGSFNKVLKTTDGLTYGINTSGGVDLLLNGVWQSLGANATDIAADASGNLYLADGSGTIRTLQGGAWTPVSGGDIGASIDKLAIGAGGQVFGLTSDGSVWGQTTSGWEQFAAAGTGTQIAAGESGLYVLSGNSHVAKYDINGFVDTGLSASSLSVAPNSGLLLVDPNGASGTLLYKDSTAIDGVYDFLTSSLNSVTVADAAVAGNDIPASVRGFVNGSPELTPPSPVPVPGPEQGLGVPPPGAVISNGGLTATISTTETDDGGTYNATYTFTSNANEPDDFSVSQVVKTYASGNIQTSVFSGTSSVTTTTTAAGLELSSISNQNGETLAVNDTYSLDSQSPLGLTQTQTGTLTDNSTGAVEAEGSITIYPTALAQQILPWFGVLNQAKAIPTMANGTGGSQAQGTILAILAQLTVGSFVIPPSISLETFNADGTYTRWGGTAANVISVTNSLPDSEGRVSTTVDFYGDGGTFLKEESVALGSGGNVDTNFNNDGSGTAVAVGPDGTRATITFDSSGNVVSANVQPGGTPMPQPGATPVADAATDVETAIPDADLESLDLGDPEFLADLGDLDIGDLLAQNNASFGGYY
jgi:hypothetical protein